MLIRVREGAARASDGCLTHRSDLAGVNQIYPVGLDTWGDRSGVVEAYADEFGGGFPEIRFTGNVAGCDAGTTSQAFRSAVMGRVNWYRAMAGLNPVSENQTYSDSAQQAALMMDAENDLSHTPGPDWACYSASGATAAGSSNLSLGYHAPNAIDGQMRDPGSNNRPVGHRRMILHPPSREMGTGDVPNAHALWVFDDHIWETDADIRSVRNFVAWPPSGFVPRQSAWGRWSFSLAGADFSNATVVVSHWDDPVEVEILARETNVNRVPGSAIVWAVAGDDNSRPINQLLALPDDEDACFFVTIGNVRISSALQEPYEYATCILPPAG